MTMPLNRNQSEIRRLLEEIDSQYQSAHQALYNLNLGTAQHAFITARMDRIGQSLDELKNLLGEDEAAKLIIQQLDKSAANSKGDNK